MAITIKGVSQQITETEQDIIASNMNIQKYWNNYRKMMGSKSKLFPAICFCEILLCSTDWESSMQVLY